MRSLDIRRPIGHVSTPNRRPKRPIDANRAACTITSLAIDFGCEVKQTACPFPTREEKEATMDIAAFDRLVGWDASAR